MAPPTPTPAQSLTDLLATTHTLLAHFSQTLHPSHPTPVDQTPIANPPDPLNVLSDAAKLVKAHATKLSLLAINKPFTPSAIGPVLKELSASCLPAMMSAVQICEQEKTVWGETLGREARARVRRVFGETDMLLEEVKAVAEGRAGRKDSLSATGVVWESCDAVIELAAGGVAGLVVKMVEQWRDTVKDAVEELREWAEGDDLGTEGQVDGLLDSDDEGVGGDQDSLDDIFNAANSMPKDRPELKGLVDQAEGKLKKVVILYNALLKRRLKTFKAGAETDGTSKGNVATLDELMGHLKKIPHQVDEVASCFYDLEEEQAKTEIMRFTSEAKTASSVVELNWEGSEDEFTAWSRKWRDAVG